MRVASIMWWHQAAWAFRSVTVVGPSASEILSMKHEIRDSYRAISSKTSARLKADINIAQSTGVRLGFSLIKFYPVGDTAFMSIF